MLLKVFKTNGDVAEEREFSVPEFEGTRGLKALKQVIVAMQANRRQGNASTKTRAEVAGTGKKPWRQKGTGMSRQGTRRAPQWTGGGRAWGPRPRDFSKKINRKMKNLAFGRIFYDCASAGNLNVIERFDVSESKTKLINAVLNKILPTGKILLIDDSWSDHVVLAARNISRVFMHDAKDVSVMHFCRFENVILSEKGLEKILSRLNGGTE